MHTHEGHLEGTVSQIIYLGLSFDFMTSRKLTFKNYPKVTRFLT